MLVTDTLDAVGAEAILQQGGTLQRFAGDDDAAGESLLHVIAAGNRASRPGGGGHAPVHAFRTRDLLHHFFHRVAGHFVVPQVVAELLELVENHQVLAGFAQFPALVEDFLDVRFGAWGLDGFPSDVCQPLEAFLAHAFRQDGDGGAGQQSGIIRAAAAEVARGRPDGFLRRRVELTGDQPRHETAECRSDLVRPGREPLAHQHHDAGLDAGQRGGQFEVVDAAKPAAAISSIRCPAFGLRLVFPSDAEQVARVHIPQADFLERFLDFGRDLGRVFHLGEGGDDDIALAGALDGACAAVLVDGEVNGGHFGKLLARKGEVV